MLFNEISCAPSHLDMAVKMTRLMARFRPMPKASVATSTSHLQGYKDVQGTTQLLTNMTSPSPQTLLPLGCCYISAAIVTYRAASL